MRVHADRRLVRARHLAGPALARELRTFLKVEDERLRIADQLGSNGHLTARARSFTVDLLVGHVFSRVCETAPLGLNGKLEDGVAIVALGGYGRDELAPFSDLDLLFLYGGQPAKPLRAAIERCLYPLWDSGLNVGQKSYAVDECVPASRTDRHFQTALVTARLVAGNSELFAGLCRALERERAKNVNLLLETINGSAPKVIRSTERQSVCRNRTSRRALAVCAIFIQCSGPPMHATAIRRFQLCMSTA